MSQELKLFALAMGREMQQWLSTLPSDLQGDFESWERGKAPAPIVLQLQ